ASTGISFKIALVVMGVFVASFAGTTLDTATRIQRYIISELFTSVRMNFLTGKYISTFLAVTTALALIIITVYLKGKGGMKWLISGIPAVFMVFMTIWALVLNQTKFGTQHNLLLQSVNGIILFIVLWISVEGAMKFFSIGAETPSRVKAD
ncbi:MAG: carbon starvation protein A, partial [Desulfobacteraceae bacterium]|nr:carbon starvation protein A [Desulfobacteraceae bacterium]